MKKIGKTKVYTLEDLAEMLQVTRRTLYNYLKSGKLEANKVANKWIVSEEQLQDFLKGDNVVKESEIIKAYGTDQIDTYDVPIFYYVDGVRFDTEKEALEYKEIISALREDTSLVEIFKIVKDDPKLIELATKKFFDLKEEKE